MNTKRKSKKVDFTKYDYQSIEYSIDKKLGCLLLHKEKPFIERMNYDVQRRQSKNSKRIQLLHTQRPTLPECERIQSFNRLIEDVNRRREKQETLKEQSAVQQANQSSKKFTPQQWNQVYKERFVQFKLKQEEKLDKMIIQKEKVEKREEEVIVETINSHTKRKNAKEIKEMVNKMWDKVNKKQEQKKEANKRNASENKGNGQVKKKCKSGTQANNNNVNNPIMKMRKDFEMDFEDNTGGSNKDGEEMNNYMKYKTNYFGLQ